MISQIETPILLSSINAVNEFVEERLQGKKGLLRLKEHDKGIEYIPAAKVSWLKKLCAMCGIGGYSLRAILSHIARHPSIIPHIPAKTGEELIKLETGLIQKKVRYIVSLFNWIIGAPRIHECPLREAIQRCASSLLSSQTVVDLPSLAVPDNRLKDDLSDQATSSSASFLQSVQAQDEESITSPARQLLKEFGSSIDAFEAELGQAYRHHNFDEHMKVIEQRLARLFRIREIRRQLKDQGYAQVEEIRGEFALIDKRYKDLALKSPSLRLYAELKNKLRGIEKRDDPWNWGSSGQAFRDQFDLYLSYLQFDPWDFYKYYTHRKEGELKKEWRRVSDTVLALIMKGAEHAQPFSTFGDRHIRWVSGSASPSLPIIFIKNHPTIPQPALIPTGELIFRHKLAPLCGELDCGIDANGVNLRCLSGVRFPNLSTAVQYANMKPEDTADIQKVKRAILDTTFSEINEKNLTSIVRINKLRISVIRFSLINTSPQDKLEVQNHLLALKKHSECTSLQAELRRDSQYKTFSRLIGEECPFPLRVDMPPQHLQTGMICGCRRSNKKITFGVLKCTNNGSEKDGVYSIIFPEGWIDVKRDELIWFSKEELQAAMQHKAPKELEGMIAVIEERLKTTYEKLDDMLHLLENNTALSFSAYERDLIYSPFGIIWASITERGEPIPSACKGEMILENKQKIGDQIQLLFVPENHISAVAQYIRKIPGFLILPMEALMYLYATQLRFNGRCVYEVDN